MRVGDKIRAALLEVGWTQRRLSEITLIPERSVSEILNNKRRVIPMTAIKLCAVLPGLRPAYLLKLQAEWDLMDFEIENPSLADEVRSRATWV